METDSECITSGGFSGSIIKANFSNSEILVILRLTDYCEIKLI